MLLIPPGTYQRGADERAENVPAENPDTYWTPEQAKGAAANQRPAHKVTLTQPFRIFATEVTIAQFAEFVKATG